MELLYRKAQCHLQPKTESNGRTDAVSWRNTSTQIIAMEMALMVVVVAVAVN